jgi:hypothetical protein
LDILDGRTALAQRIEDGRSFVGVPNTINCERKSAFTQRFGNAQADAAGTTRNQRHAF